MAEIVPIDYPQIALSLLIERFRDSEDLKKILNITAEASMELQTTIFEIRDRFILPTAQGAELTIIGDVWDTSRRLDIVETDEEYKIKISAKAVLSISGTIAEIKEVLYLFYDATYIEYITAYPAGYHLLTNATITQLGLDKITAVGVKSFLASRSAGTTMPLLLGWAIWKPTI